MGDYVPQELESRLFHKTDVQLEQTTTTIIPTTSNITNVHQTDTSRQSNTPVVSLLSIDHQQEKDLTSMQGGRRRKSPSQTQRASTPHNHNFMPNGFQSGYSPVPPQSHNPNPYSHHHSHSQPSQHTYSQNMYLTHVPSLSHHQQQPHHHHHSMDYGYNNPNISSYNKNLNNNRLMMNGYDKLYINNNIRKKRTYVNDKPYKQHQYNSDHTVIVRSDSNSSASVVDENRNENKIVSSSDNYNFVTSSSTVTTSTYSTLNKVSNNSNINNNIVRYNNWPSFNNNNNNNIRSGGFNQDKRVNIKKTYVPRRFYNSNNNNNTSHKEQNTTTTTTTTDTNNYVYNKNNLINLNNNKSNNVVPVNCEISTITTTTNCIDLTKTISHQNAVPISQIPASSQHFAPPSRRNRKTVRRNTTTSTTAISEIGAGDAPLPVQDVNDTGKKLESLKL